MSENCKHNHNICSSKYSEINSFKERAVELFKQGYNCSQSVFAAFCEECGMDFETALRISSSFGGGMGRLREVCGAVSGMFMVAGMKYGYVDPKDRLSKAEHYKRIQQLAEKFKENNGSLICRELLGLSVQSESYIPEERTKEYYKKRPCVEIVGSAAEIMYEYIKSNKQSS
ncbi:C-GCAxxG-C-C family protein [Clostridium sp. JS66]|uniref:C-GCAxxG-C-C family protein n=1 Tax=Clostridium sp. JS66 TaxID=3064705 RepID=UPI00298DCE54|nr:C-GCAxxG-C-C family protein [Clostridium sp. JS66]WPC43809.1 C-GCAxxG-C-C family protein [Clostridium sp. JS66]